MLFDAPFGTSWESLTYERQNINPCLHDRLTLAISPQLLPASRICFSRCSSAAVHGVLVRPRFFALPSLRSDETGTEPGALARSLVGAAGDDDSNAGLREARRFLGFEGEGSGGGTVLRVVLGAKGGGWVAGRISDSDCVGGGFEGESFCLF